MEATNIRACTSNVAPRTTTAKILGPSMKTGPPTKGELPACLDSNPFVLPWQEPGQWAKTTSE